MLATVAQADAGKILASTTRVQVSPGDWLDLGERRTPNPPLPRSNLGSLASAPDAEAVEARDCNPRLTQFEFGPALHSSGTVQPSLQDRGTPPLAFGGAMGSRRHGRVVVMVLQIPKERADTEHYESAIYEPYGRVEELRHNGTPDIRCRRV